MKVNTYYSHELKTWVAYITDENDDQIGDAQHGNSKEYAAFLLGMAYEKHPVKFSKPLSELVGEPMQKPIC